VQRGHGHPHRARVVLSYHQKEPRLPGPGVYFHHGRDAAVGFVAGDNLESAGKICLLGQRRHGKAQKEKRGCFHAPASRNTTTVELEALFASELAQKFLETFAGFFFLNLLLQCLLW